MASLYVRDLIRQWAAVITATPGEPPYYDTVNAEVTPQDDIWWTVDFGISEQEKSTFCGDRHETGVLSVLFFGRPGVGDVPLLTAALAVVQLLMANVDLAVPPLLTLEDYGAPQEFTEGDGHNRWYGIEFQISYAYYL